MSIYIASKTRHAALWRDLRDAGAPIISTWIDEAGEGESADLDDLWRRCIAESCACDTLIVYREPQDVLKGAWVEIGAALASGNPVYAVGLNGFTISNYRGITHFQSLAAAFAAAGFPKRDRIMTAYAAVIEASDRAEKKVAILRRALLLKIGPSGKVAANTTASSTKKPVKLVRKKEELARQMAHITSLAERALVLTGEASTVPSADRCARCGCETKGEVAWVNGAEWCHPCADTVAVPSTGRETPL